MTATVHPATMGRDDDDETTSPHWHGRTTTVECPRGVTACLLGCAYGCFSPCPCGYCRRVKRQPIGPFGHAMHFARCCVPWLSLRPVVEWNCADIPHHPRALITSSDGDLSTMEAYDKQRLPTREASFSGRYRAHDGGGLGHQATGPGWLGQGGHPYAMLVPPPLQQRLRRKAGLPPRCELCVRVAAAAAGDKAERSLYFRFADVPTRRAWVEKQGLGGATRAIRGGGGGGDDDEMLLLTTVDAARLEAMESSGSLPTEQAPHATRTPHTDAPW
jgi:hypothetical protein